MIEPIMTMLITMMVSEGQTCMRLEEDPDFACETCPLKDACPVSEYEDEDDDYE